MTHSTVCVTGGGGYIGTWIVKFLLDNHYNVRATVRSKNGKNYKHLTKENLSPNSSGNLELYEADLLKPNSFDLAFKDCDIVVHCASPYIITKRSKDPENELIKPAIIGVQNVLDSVNKSESVKTVILTSSILAISSIPSESKIFDENCWSYEANIYDSPYPLSKLLAEEKAWEMFKAQKRWGLTVINPGMIIGPTLSDRTNDGSIGLMKDILRGKYIICPKISLPVVDIRDVAQAHINAIEKQNVAIGQRYLCASEAIYIKDLSFYLRNKYGKRFWLPVINAPKWSFYLMLPFLPLTRKMAKSMLWTPFLFSNTKIKRDLGLQFNSTETSVCDMVESMIKFRLV